MSDHTLSEPVKAGAGSWPLRLLSRFFVLISTLLWRACVDWRTRRPALTRVSAHVSLALLAIAVLALGRIEPPAQAWGSPSSDGGEIPPAPIVVEESAFSWRPAAAPMVTRQALPHTTIPPRPRSSVITYTVLSGDTVFGIAEQFGLTPYTIYWANSETLQDNPHRLWPDMKLNILPVNGVYHTVTAGETVASIASDYGVDPSVLYNEWNRLQQGQPLQAGMNLVIPGGSREFIVWQLPQPSALRGSAAYDSGLCQLPAVWQPGYGWFDWPTDSRRISGWIFHDPTNPPHGGIDIGVRVGDPIYAADSGAVAYAGWSNAGYGYLVVIDHGNGYQTYYAHLSAIWVYCGQAVSKGTVIGAGGSTGWSTGPHLHFEIRYDGYPQDPFHYLP
ncbi:MAG: peptidoglycan DD-metalloendopeptidase family protein [Anaerolineae bacterium]|nr:peptidoglycan DD-metalloendopeptidase family protein [Anaerolineae bacterium]